MSKYTPTTQEMLKKYIFQGGTFEEFDRWLNQVEADVWDEGWNAGASWPQDDTNPYRKQEEA